MVDPLLLDVTAADLDEGIVRTTKRGKRKKKRP